MKKKKPEQSIVKRVTPARPLPSEFDQVPAPINAARTRAVAAVNTTLIDLYWSIGKHISGKIADGVWGQGTVNALAEYIRRRQPNARGFSSQNLWRMRQFYETYRDHAKLSPLVRELSWTHNMLILSRSRCDEEREFYLKMCARERWGKRELERQLNGALFRARRPLPRKTVTTVDSFAPRRRRRLQGHLPHRIPQPLAGPQSIDRTTPGV